MDEQRYLSYNFKPHYVGRNDIGWLFEEAYLFLNPIFSNTPLNKFWQD